MLTPFVLTRGLATQPPLPSFVPPPSPQSAPSTPTPKLPRIVGRVPYGYRLAPAGGLAIVPVRASVVRAIFHAFLRSRSLTAVTSDLNGGVYAYAGARHWSRASVRRLLRNRAYIGLHRQGSVPALGIPLWVTVPPIVSLATFSAVDSILTVNLQRRIHRRRRSRRRTP